MGYISIILSSTAVYLFIVIAIRLFGKTEIAQLSVADLVFILLISNAVQNAMVGPDTSLLGGLVAAATLFLINAVFKECMYRLPWFGRVMLAAVIVSYFAGKKVAHKIAEPLNHINLEKPLANKNVEEIRPLLERLDEQNTKINEQMEVLHRKQKEFITATSSMESINQTEYFLVIGDA